MKRFLHIQRYRSLVLVALAVLWAAFMMISSPAVIADKGGKGNPHDTTGTTPTGDTTGGDTSSGDTSGGNTTGTTPTGDTTGTTPTGDTTGGDTSSGDTSGGNTTGTTPTGDTTGTTPTGDTTEDTSSDGELGLPHTDEYLCLNFGLNCSLSPARDTGWHFEDYLAYCLSWELDPFNGECYDPMGGYS